MILIKAEIKNGPRKRDLYRAHQQHKKVFFKIEGADRPAIIQKIVPLKSKSRIMAVNILGYTLTGLFAARYYFRSRTGKIITRQGRIVNDIK